MKSYKEIIEKLFSIICNPDNYLNLSKEEISEIEVLKYEYFLLNQLNK